MKTSEETDKLFEALTKAQAEMPEVKKTATNPHFGSSYATLDLVAQTAQPILAKHELGIVTGCSQIIEEGLVCVSTRVIHSSGQWIESTQVMKPRKNDPQGVGACITYGSRYGYRMVGVVTEEDDDGNSASKKDKQQDNGEDFL